MSFIFSFTVLTFCNLIEINNNISLRCVAFTDLRCVAFTDLKCVALTDLRCVAFTDLRCVAFTDLMKKAAAPDGGWLVWVAML